jgi:transposase-like protein
LGSLEAITEIRAYLEELERAAIASAREKGATVEDIAAALWLTPQAIYYRFRQERESVQTTPGQPNVAAPAPNEARPRERHAAARLADAAAPAPGQRVPTGEAVLPPEPKLSN